jgi:PhnB protein
MYVPEGYGTVFPYMIVNGAEALARFLADVFDASEVGRTTLPNGRIANLRTRIGTSTFMVSKATGDAMPAMPAAYYVYVDDVDSTFEKALTRGASRIIEPMDMPYLDRQAGVTDRWGNILWISRRLVDEPYDA